MCSTYRGSSGTAVCVWCRCTLCTEEVQVRQCVCGADVHYVQRKFRYGSVCVVQMYIMYRGSSGMTVCVCGADVHYVQRKFRYDCVCVVQMYIMYRGSSGMTACVWCRCTVCAEEVQV